jgi:type IV secretion system protein TrbG
MTQNLMIPLSVALCFACGSACFAANDNMPGTPPPVTTALPAPTHSAATDLNKNILQLPAHAPALVDVAHYVPRKNIRHRNASARQRRSTPPAVVRVSRANVAARSEPVADQYLNAIQVYPFTDGTLYRLYAAVGRISDIVLEPGEQLIDKAAGDTVRWVVGDTMSGMGKSQQTHVLVKPVAANLRTNLIITTNRRTYHLELVSTRETYMASLSWHYPQSSLPDNRASDRATYPASTESSETKAPLSPATLNFDYGVEGPKLPWKPVRAFDDGVHVYLQFARSLQNHEAAPLFVIGNEGSELVNYRQQGNTYIVDRLFDRAELRLGTGKQQVVRIFRLNANKSEPRAVVAGAAR